MLHKVLEIVHLLFFFSFQETFLLDKLSNSAIAHTYSHWVTSLHHQSQGTHYLATYIVWLRT